MTKMLLPIDAVLPEIVDSLRRHNSIIIRAPTGAGKTTRVPPALLAAGFVKGRIIMLEPRRLAARAAARRIVMERGELLGGQVGYQVRFERRFGPDTRILVVTEGVLVRMLQEDPFLEAAGAVVFDEFHERSLDSDLALGMVRRVQQTVRPDLRIVVMSATLPVEGLAAYLEGAALISSDGRQYPVEITYQNPPRQRTDSRSATGGMSYGAIVNAIKQSLDGTDGDVLVFLPGLREIRQTGHHLEGLAQERNLAVVPLYGDLPAEKQDAALLPQKSRKIVLTTNLAETSVTVEGITAVVDTGLARVMSFDPRLGLDRLRLMPISQASAEQRAGRAGRTRSGVCIRLWSELSHHSRPQHTEPEIRRVDLAGAVLQLYSWGESNILDFPWLEAPPETTLNRARVLLRRLQAIDDRGITQMGQAMSRLPVHPRIGRLLLEGQAAGHAEKAALAAALLSERDPFLRPEAPASKAVSSRRTPQYSSRSDVLDRVEALEEYARNHQRDTRAGAFNRGVARHVLQARKQLLDMVRREQRVKTKENQTAEEAIGRALLAAFPDRLIRRRAPGDIRGVMVGGRGVRLGASSHVLEPELFVAIEVDAGRTEAVVHQASAVERAWLPEQALHTLTEVTFDQATERVLTRRKLLYEDLLIEESLAALPDDDQVTEVLAKAAVEHIERVLPPDDSPAANFLRRVRFLRAWAPELELPGFEREQLKELMPAVCAGARSFAEVQNADWLALLRSRLTVRQLQAIDREAPERLRVPSGNHIALKYEDRRPPVLAVRIQEMFGLQQTPTLAAGRVRVLLHLLGPNYRPQQVTDDLASFWKNTYPRVRKDLRARYPKHAWPEDPLAEPPQSRPRRPR